MSKTILKQYDTIIYIVNLVMCCLLYLYITHSVYMGFCVFVLCVMEDDISDLFITLFYILFFDSEKRIEFRIKFSTRLETFFKYFIDN